MSLMVRYRPKTFKEFVGRAAREQALRLLRRRPLRVMLVEDYGCGKTTLAYLLAKAHLCIKAEEGPCGSCQRCLTFDEQWGRGGGRFYLPGQDRGDELPWFEAFDFTNTSTEEVKRVRQLVSPYGRIQPTIEFKDHPEVVVFDEAHRAKDPVQELLLKPLEGELAASVIMCVARDNLERVIPPLRQRLHPLTPERPELGELTAWVMEIAEKEGIRVENTAAVEDLVAACSLVPREILRALDSIAIEGSPLTSAAVRRVEATVTKPVA